MMIDVLFVNEWIILAATTPVPSVTAEMNSITLHNTAQTRFLYQEQHTTKTSLIQGHDTPTPEGQITLHSLWTQTWETFQPITIMPPFEPLQWQQQFWKAHIPLPIQPSQWFMPLFG